MPSSSISSRASRSPAVSMNTTGSPRMFAVSSIVVARRAGDVRDDGAVVAEQLIQQTGFAPRWGRPHNRRANAAPEDLAFVGGAQTVRP